MGLPRFLNLDALAARFNRWLGPAAVASGAGPGDAKNGYDPRAIVAGLGEIEHHRDEATGDGGEDDLPPLNLDSASLKELQAPGVPRETHEA